MWFINLMRSPAGRTARILAGAAIIAAGLGAIRGATGVAIAMAGVVPLTAGLTNTCLVCRAVGCDLRGGERHR